jgi:type IV secretory pathway VirB6-like protein
MAEIHSTLKTSTNTVMIFLWGALAGIFAYLSAPHSLLIITIGAILGAIGGTMQYYAFAESKEKFLDTSSMLEIRKKLKETKWGKRYIPFLWAGNLLLVIVVIVLHRGNMPLEIMAGYFSLMFIREIITLKPTIELGELSKQNPEQKH